MFFNYPKNTSVSARDELLGMNSECLDHLADDLIQLIYMLEHMLTLEFFLSPLNTSPGTYLV